jgi:hypothetical protein
MAIQTNGSPNGTIASQKNGRMIPKPDPPVDIGIALRANDPNAIPEILKDISSFIDTPVLEKDTDRLALLAKARDLVRALETPRETMIKHCWAQVGQFLRVSSYSHDSFR